MVTSVLQVIQRVITRHPSDGAELPADVGHGGAVTLFKSLMAGEHCLQGFTNRDIRSRLTGTRWRRACADDPKKASAKVGRCFRRLHARGLIAKIPRARRWRVTDCGRKVMGTTRYLREYHFPNAYAGVVH